MLESKTDEEKEKKSCMSRNVMK